MGIQAEGNTARGAAGDAAKARGRFFASLRKSLYAGANPPGDALWERIGRADFLSDDEKRQAVGYGG